jgi:sugar/nucleoside kinase (ribokinase family)
MKKPDIIVALDMVIGCFEKLGVAYYIGGSVASSAYGIARATMDVDLVADIKTDQVNLLVKALETSYYIDAETIRKAIHRSTSFNLIHLETMIKIDVFIVKDQPYDSESLTRRCADTLDEESSREFYLSSAEDIILSKLRWYQGGGGVSEQQWKDVLGVLKVQADKLDLKYLKYWASRLNLSALLNRSFDDAGIIESA